MASWERPTPAPEPFPMVFMMVMVGPLLGTYRCAGSERPAQQAPYPQNCAGQPLTALPDSWRTALLRPMGTGRCGYGALESCHSMGNWPADQG